MDVVATHAVAMTISTMPHRTIIGRCTTMFLGGTMTPTVERNRLVLQFGSLSWETKIKL